MMHTHFNFGSWNPEESRLLRFNYGQEMADYNRRADQEIGRFEQGRDQRRNQFEQHRQDAQTLLAELNRRAEEIEAKSGDASSYRDIAKEVRTELTKFEQTFDQWTQRAGKEIGQSVVTKEWTDPQGRRTTYGFEARVAATNYWFAAEDYLLSELAKTLGQYTRGAKKVETDILERERTLSTETNRKVSAWSADRTAIYDDDTVRDAEVEEKKALRDLSEAKKEEVRGGIGALKLQEKNAKKKLDAAQAAFNPEQQKVTDKQKEINDAKEAKTKLTTAEGELKPLQDELKALEDALPPLKDEIRDQKFYFTSESLDYTKITAGKSEELIDAEDTKATAEITAINAKPIATMPEAEKQKEREKVNEKRKKHIEAIKKADELEKKLKTNTDRTAVLKGAPPAGGEIQKKEDEIRDLKTKAVDPVPLEANLVKLKNDLKPFQTALDEAKKELGDVLEKKADASTVPEAKKKYDEARANLAEAKKLKLRKADKNTRENYKASAGQAVHAINVEGTHIQQNLEQDARAPKRLVDLVQQKTDILTDVLSRRREELTVAGKLKLPNKPVELEKFRKNAADYLLSIRGELRLRNKYDIRDTAREQELIDREADWSPIMKQILERQVDMAVTSPKASPEARYAAMQRLCLYGETYHPDEDVKIGGADIHTEDLHENAETIAEPLKKVLWDMHSPLHAATEAILAPARATNCNNLSKADLSRASTVVSDELIFLRKYPYDAARAAKLKTDWQNVNRVITERGLNELEQASKKSIEEAGSSGGKKRFDAIGALENQAAAIRDPDAKKAPLAQIEEQFGHIQREAEGAAQNAQFNAVSIDKMGNALTQVNEAVEFINARGRDVSLLRGKQEALRNKLSGMAEDAASAARQPSAPADAYTNAFHTFDVALPLCGPDMRGGFRGQQVRQLRSEVYANLTKEITELDNTPSLNAEQIQRGNALVKVNRAFNLSDEWGKQNTWWLGELDRIEEKFDKASRGLKGLDKVRNAREGAEASELSRSVAVVEAKGAAEKWQDVPWLEQQERVLASTLEKGAAPSVNKLYDGTVGGPPTSDVTPQGILNRVRYQLWAARSARPAEEKRTQTAFAAELTGKMNPELGQSLNMLEDSYQKVSMNSGSPELVKPLREQLTKSAAVLAKAREYKATAPSMTVDTTALDQSMKALQTRMAFVQDFVNKL